MPYWRPIVLADIPSLIIIINNKHFCEKRADVKKFHALWNRPFIKISVLINNDENRNDCHFFLLFLIRIYYFFTNFLQFLSSLFFPSLFIFLFYFLGRRGIKNLVFMPTWTLFYKISNYCDLSVRDLDDSRAKKPKKQTKTTSLFILIRNFEGGVVFYFSLYLNVFSFFFRLHAFLPYFTVFFYFLLNFIKSLISFFNQK